MSAGAEFQHERARGFLETVPLEGVNVLLDAGAGEGLQTAWFREHGVPRVVPFDREPREVEGEWTGDLHRLPFRPGVYDAVWCNQVLEHVLSPLTVLREFWRVTKRKGWLWLAVPTTTGVVSSGHINEFTFANMVYLLALAGYDVRSGYFSKSGSTLRCAVRKLSRPVVSESIQELAEANQFPKSVTEVATKTGRLHEDFLKYRWFPRKRP